MFKFGSGNEANAVIDHERTRAFAPDRLHRPPTDTRETTTTTMYTDTDNTGCPIVPRMTTDTETTPRRETLEEEVWSHRTDTPTEGERR